MARRKILIVSPEQLRRSRTGVAIRLTEIARELSRHHDVTLAAPSIETELALPFRTTTYAPPPLRHLVRECHVAIVHGHVSNEVLASEPRVPLVFDLYDPFVVENLAYAETLGPAVFRYDRLTIERQLENGDFFLVASETQRAFYLGMLTLLARVNPATYAKGRDFRHLVSIVPFGVPDPARTPPPARTGAYRARLGLKGEPLVFFGGIYDWYDPLLALEALKEVASRWPDVRLLFVRNPNAATTPQVQLERTQARAAELGLERNVILTDWIPFDERGPALADSDVGLIVHREGFETDVSIRTRVLDFLWAGMPVIASSGGSASEIIGKSGGGRLVAPGDLAALAAMLSELLADETARRAMGEAGRSYVLQNLTWEKVLAPLVAWLREPAIDPYKPGQKRSAAPSRGWRRLLGL